MSPYRNPPTTRTCKLIHCTHAVGGERETDRKVCLIYSLDINIFIKHFTREQIWKLIEKFLLPTHENEEEAELLLRLCELRRI